MAIKYKEDPNNDDFMKEVMELLGDDIWINEREKSIELSLISKCLIQ